MILGSSLNVISFGLYIPNIDVSQFTIKGLWGKSLADEANKLEENQKEVDDLKVDNAVLKKEICSASQLDEELFANLQDTVNAKNQELAQLKTQVSSLASKLMDMVEPKN